MITLFAKNATDFGTNGMAILDGACLSSEITEDLNGEYGIDLEIRSDSGIEIDVGMVLRAPAPTRPSIELRNVETHKVYETTTSAPMKTNASYVKGSVLRTLKSGTRVIWARTSDNGSWYKCTTMAGAEGWIEVSKLVYVGEESAEAEGYQVVPEQSADQLFRIGSVSHTLESVTIHADHIFYDLAGNYVKTLELNSVSGGSALADLLGACLMDHDFEGYSDVTGTATISASRRNPVDVLLAVDGFRQYNAQLLRDNFNVYLMSRVGENRSALISYRKNITGMSVDVDMSTLVTHVIPIGYWRSGNPMYLVPDPVVASPRAGDYPVRRVAELDCRDAKIGPNYPDDVAVRAELQVRADAYFEAGADLPTVTVDVDYVHAPSAVTDAMRCIYLGDTVTFRHEIYGFDMPLQVTGYIWDALNRWYTALTLSSKNPATAGIKVNKNLIPLNAIAGRLIAPQSILAAALSPEAAEAVVASTQPQAPVQNALYLNTDPESGQIVLQRYEGDEWRTISAGGVFSPASEDGTEHTTVDSTGGYLPQLSSPNVAPRYNGPAALTVNSATDPDGVTYFTTIYDAISVLRGRWLDSAVTITVAATYADYNPIDIVGICGSGTLTIEGAGKITVYNAIRIENCGISITINGVKAKYSTSPLYVIACPYVVADGCTFEATAATEVISVKGGSTVRITDTTMAAGNFSMRAWYGSRVTLYNCTGDKNLCSHAAFVIADGTLPSASAVSVTTTAYQNGFIDVTGSTVSRGSGAGTIPSAPATGDTEELYVTETAWHQGSLWCEASQTGYARQGYTGYGQITGCMWFDMSSLAGKSAAGVKLRLTRSAGYGFSEAVSVRVMGLGTACTGRGTAMTRTADYGTIGKVMPGETKEFTLPNAAGDALINGTIGGLCVFVSDAAKAPGYLWSVNYAQFMGTSGTGLTKPKLTVYT